MTRQVPPRQLLADTSRQTWLILKSYLTALLPLLAVVIVVGLISDRVGVRGGLETARDNSLEFLANVAFAVVASRLFDWIGHQVKGLPAGPAQSAEQPSSAG